MRACEVRSPEDALAYLADCTLATVSDMAMKKSRGKHEFNRQINIAQKAVDWMIDLDVDYSSTRAKQVVEEFGGSVAQWAEQYIDDTK